MHPCSDHSGEGPSVLDLPLPAALKRHWLDLATRRQFLGRSGKALAWAGLANLLARDQAFASGLFDDTLVVWGGEFGRTVDSQGGLTKETYGRDHPPPARRGSREAHLQVPGPRPALDRGGAGEGGEGDHGVRRTAGAPA